MTNDIPNELKELPIHWQGADDSTPAGCTLFVTEVFGIPTTYVIRDGAVIGRIEGSANTLHGYASGGLKGGGYLGTGDFYGLAQKVAGR